MIFLPSCGRLGSTRLRAPVAMMMCLPSTTCFFPSAPVTSIFLPGWSLPVPMITSILFFFIKNCTPLLMPSATPRLRATMAFMSALPPFTVMP